MMMKSTFSPLHLKFAIFENSSSTNIMLMEEFHDFAMMYLICIMMFLTVVITRILFTKFSNLNFMENVNMEIIWTIIPIGILIFLAYPSIYYLYLFDLSLNPMVTVKVFGFQWYWSYENFLSNIEDFKNLPMKSQTYEESFNIYGNKLKNDSKKEMNQFSLPSTLKKVKFNLNKGEKSSYMIPDNELVNSNMYMKGWRLLETDNRLIVPYGMEIQCLTTSMDVIHSFSIPDLGIKVDAIPGRLNSISFEILKPGLFYGQCSEICGTGHAFMPISMEAF